MVQEGAVEASSDCFIASEAEGDIGHATADLATWAQPLDLPSCADEVHCIVVVLCHAGTHSQDVGVKDDVLGVKAHILYQDPERSGADAHLVLSCGSLHDLQQAFVSHLALQLQCKIAICIQQTVIVDNTCGRSGDHVDDMASCVTAAVRYMIVVLYLHGDGSLNLNFELLEQELAVKTYAGQVSHMELVCRHQLVHSPDIRDSVM